MSDAPYSGAVSSVEQFRRLAIEALVHDPIAWVRIKIDAFPGFWFRNPAGANPYEYLENGLLLVLLIIVIVFSWRALKVSPRLLWASFLLSVLVPAFVFHFEARYFYPLKTVLPLVGVLCVPSIAGWFGGSTRRRRIIGTIAPGSFLTEQPAGTSADRYGEVATVPRCGLE